MFHFFKLFSTSLVFLLMKSISSFLLIFFFSVVFAVFFKREIDVKLLLTRSMQMPTCRMHSSFFTQNRSTEPQTQRPSHPSLRSHSETVQCLPPSTHENRSGSTCLTFFELRVQPLRVSFPAVLATQAQCKTERQLTLSFTSGLMSSHSNLRKCIACSARLLNCCQLETAPTTVKTLQPKHRHPTLLLTAVHIRLPSALCENAQLCSTPARKRTGRNRNSWLLTSLRRNGEGTTPKP